METRTKEIEEPLNVPTSEGLIANLDVSLLYRIDPTKADQIYSTLGESYQDVIIIPTLRNVSRDVVANYVSDDLYGANRGKITIDILAKLRESYEPRGINAENVLLRDVSLPTQVTEAINTKIGEKQRAEQMEYTLQRESQEAERRRIEARGISDAQAIVAESLTPEYLQWRYITTLEGLAGSPNNTFIVAPFDQTLIPMLNVQGQPR